MEFIGENILFLLQVFIFVMECKMGKDLVKHTTFQPNVFTTWACRVSLKKASE